MTDYGRFLTDAIWDFSESLFAKIQLEGYKFEDIYEQEIQGKAFFEKLQGNYGRDIKNLIKEMVETMKMEEILGDDDYTFDRYEKWLIACEKIAQRKQILFSLKINDN